MKKKIALLFSGQVRNVDPVLFNKSLKFFIKNFKADIYIATWDSVGVSFNHFKKVNISENYIYNAEDFIKKAFSGIDVKKVYYFNEKKEIINFSSKKKKLLFSKSFTKLSTNSLQQLYLIYQSYNIIPKNNLKKYSHFFRLRLDSFFVCELLKKDLKLGITNMNFGKNFTKFSIFDIFFIVSKKYAKNIFSTWLTLEKIISQNNKLNPDSRNAGLLLYKRAKHIKSKIYISNLRYAHVNRQEGIFLYLSRIIFLGLVNSSKSISLTKFLIKKYLNHLGKNFYLFLFFFSFYIIYKKAFNIYSNFLKTLR
jgi:hypothetical protein